MGKKIFEDLKNLKPSKKIAVNSFSNAVNGNLVRKRMNEIVNSILDSIRNHGQYDIKYNQIINDIFQNIYGI